MGPITSYIMGWKTAHFFFLDIHLSFCRFYFNMENIPVDSSVCVKL